MVKLTGEQIASASQIAGPMGQRYLRIRRHLVSGMTFGHPHAPAIRHQLVDNLADVYRQIKSREREALAVLIVCEHGGNFEPVVNHEEELFAKTIENRAADAVRDALAEAGN